MPPTLDKKQTTESSREKSQFTVEVATKKIERPEDLPIELLRFIVKHILWEVKQKTDGATTELFEEQFPPITSEHTHEQLLYILDSLKNNFADKFDVSALLTEAYPLLYQVHTADPNGPVVSFFSFSDSYMDKHVLTAWTAAATSRSADPYSKMFDDMLEMVSGDESAAAERIEKWGLNYGHSSILELVPVFVFINNIPITHAYLIHHLIETYASQELSTRYVEFLNRHIRPLEDTLDLNTLPLNEQEYIKAEWEALQKQLFDNFEKWKNLIGPAYQEQFGDVAENGKKIGKATKDARLLDIIRAWLPMGLPTSMAVLSNLRTYIGLIRMLRESNSQELYDLADQIEYALRVSETQVGKTANAHLGPLVKHSEAQNVIKTNIANLKDYLHFVPGFDNLLADVKKPDNYNRETVVALLDNTDNVIITVIEYIKVAYPQLDEFDILDWLGTLNANEQANIGSIIFRDHMRHKPMGNMGNIQGDKLVIIKAALGQLRDWNRHRASGRADVGFMLPVHHNTGPTDFTSIINQGFVTSLQIMETDGLKQFVEQWKTDANNYYIRLQAFYEYLRFRFPDAPLNELTRVIPLGHQTTFHLSTPVSQNVYTTNQRGTTGNDLTNRYITEQIVELTSTSPFLRDVNLGNPEQPLDFNDSVQYAERV